MFNGELRNRICASSTIYSSIHRAALRPLTSLITVVKWRGVSESSLA